MENYTLSMAQIAKEIKDKNRRIVSSYKLSPNEIDVLVFLDIQSEHDTASDIVEFLGISKSLVCRSVDSLIKRGYIESVKDENDRRITRLKLLEEAMPIVRTLKDGREKIIKRLTEGISEEELKIFNSVLEKMKSNFMKEGEE
ncbi:MarR family transcriptional regulator [Romboutsia ilealis]|uniref:MarR family transcriptional regulator n=1 Tax=Romboutsia faecis TaxID=2764597 RepID=A0ABR7JPN0_9FIRM|nr:MarR family transcriptional regulator [Romboutsia faecis]MBC5996867.1 MarR family transcriptional regulator [Romboutsia faecis]MRN24629.1 MarR family transcriptional regulator [Romboutsia ilealis]